MKAAWRKSGGGGNGGGIWRRRGISRKLAVIERKSLSEETSSYQYQHRAAENLNKIGGVSGEMRRKYHRNIVSAAQSGAAGAAAAKSTAAAPFRAARRTSCLRIRAALPICRAAPRGSIWQSAGGKARHLVKPAKISNSEVTAAAWRKSAAAASRNESSVKAWRHLSAGGC